MTLVEQPVAEPASPQDVEAGVRAEGCDDAPDHRRLVQVTELDTRDRRFPRDACRDGEVLLAPPASATDGAQQRPNSSVVHVGKDEAEDFTGADEWPVG